MFGVELYGTVLGLLSLSIEATLGFPQLISNQKSRSVDGLSIFMVVTWFVGDFLKTIYFIVEVLMPIARTNLSSSSCRVPSSSQWTPSS